MGLDRIRDRGFRSIRDLTFEPESLSVLTGPNNAGKSNLVATIEFIGGIYGNGLDSALAARGGIGQLLFRGPKADDVDLEFDIEATLSVGEVLQAEVETGMQDRSYRRGEPWPEIKVRHRFGLQTIDTRSLAISSVRDEEIVVDMVHRGERHPVLRFSNLGSTSMLVQQWRSRHPAIHDADFLRATLFRTLNDPSPSADFNAVSEHELPSVYDEPHRRELAIGKLRFFSQVIKAFTTRLSTIRLYSPIPMFARQPALPLYIRDLGPDGRNLPTLVYRLQDAEQDAWLEVLQALRQVSPEMDRVTTEFGKDGNLSLKFYDRVDGDTVERTATEVSDGTIRSLAMFSDLFDPHTPLLAFEEPENSLHPWALRVFIDSCRRSSTQTPEKQIVLTTHSPILLDYVLPEEVFIVWRAEGETRIDRLVKLDPDAQRLWAQGDTMLSDVIDSGLLRESIPGGVR